MGELDLPASILAAPGPASGAHQEQLGTRLEVVGFYCLVIG